MVLPWEILVKDIINMQVSWTIVDAVLGNICRRFERRYCLHLYRYAAEEFSIEKEAMIL